MLWNVAAPFFPPAHAGMARWIDDFVPAGAHSFRKIPFAHGAGDDWHQRASRGTPLGGWKAYWQTAGRCFGAGPEGGDGIITVFPQLAVTAGLQRLLRLQRRRPIVAWCFNIGALPGGARRTAARIALGGVERIVVHSTAEVPLIADYLGIPHDRVRFVPLQRAPIESDVGEEQAAPFIVAMGSANRDYATLVEAARSTGLPLTIVASERSVAGIDLPANVTFRTGLSAAQCHALASAARFSVVPLADVGAASGQVTVIEAQRLGRAVIATRSLGTTDYVDDGRTGRLVPAGDAAAMAAAMSALWHDAAARARLAEGGAAFAREALSDEAAGRALGAILDEVAAGR